MNIWATAETNQPASQSPRLLGDSQKSVRSLHGAIDLEIPRDRAGTCEPIVVKKHQRDLSLLEDKVISRYAFV